MKLKALFLTAALMAAVCVTPAHAMDYTVEASSAGDFGTPTSDETVYVGTENTVNMDRSKNSSLTPPGFGTPTSNLPGSGEPLTPNLAGSGSTVIAVNPGGAGGIVPPTYPTTSDPDVTYPATAHTAVTSDLYYSGGYLATLKILDIGLTVKVYQGTDSTQLAKGVGHFTSTSIWDGNVAIAAHNRGVNNHFGQIHTLDVGDRITLTTKLGTRTYTVAEVFKVSETDNSMLSDTSDNCITLFTCVRDQSAYRWCVRAIET